MRGLATSLAAAICLCGVWLPWHRASRRLDSAVVVAQGSSSTTMPPFTHRFPALLACEPKTIGGCMRRCFDGSSAKDKGDLSKQAAALDKMCGGLRCLHDCTKLDDGKCSKKGNR